MRCIMVTSALAVVLVGGITVEALAADLEASCASSRLKATAKYMSCLLKEQGLSIKGGGAPQWGECDAALTAGWAKAEEKGAGKCPKTGELGEAMEIVSSGAQALATAPSIENTVDACEPGKLTMSAKYFACRLKREASFAKKSGGRAPDFSKCDAGLAGKWTKFETKSAGQCPSTGDQTEAQGILAAASASVSVALALKSTVQCGDNTVTDPNTGLTWQLIDDDGGLTDKDKTYSWCIDNNRDQVCDNFLAFDGTAATVFLARLNTPPCFGGRCDWRLPTASEFSSIRGPTWCASDTGCCIDETISGPSGKCFWWSPHTTPDICYYNDACYITYMDLDECPPLGDLLWRTDNWTGSDAVVLTGHDNSFEGWACTAPPEEGHNCFGDDSAHTIGSCGGLYGNKPFPTPVRAVSSGACSPQ